MVDRKMHHSVSFGSVASTVRRVSFGYAFLSSLLLGTVLLVAAATGTLSTASDRARLVVTWNVTRGDYIYRLRGSYSITSASDVFATSIANEVSSQTTTSEVYVPAGLYRVTLDPGYTLERSVDPSDEVSGALVGASFEVVPASLLTLNPVLVSAQEGSVARLGLSLVDMPGTAAEPESTCMNGS